MFVTFSGRAQTITAHTKRVSQRRRQMSWRVHRSESSAFRFDKWKRADDRRMLSSDRHNQHPHHCRREHRPMNEKWQWSTQTNDSTQSIEHVRVLRLSLPANSFPFLFSIFFLLFFLLANALTHSHNWFGILTTSFVPTRHCLVSCDTVKCWYKRKAMHAHWQLGCVSGTMGFI